MQNSIIKAHIQQLVGSGRSLKHLIIERSLESAYTEYSCTYTPPSQHIIVAPSSSMTSLAWNRESSVVRTQKNFSPGDLILNPSGCFTRPQWDRDTRFTLVAIDPNGIRSVCDELEIADVDVPMKFHFTNGALYRTVQRLISCFETDPPPLMEAQTLELTLMRNFIGECRTLRSGMHQLSKKRLALVNDFINERIAHAISLEELASIAGYSPSRFLLLFRNSTGYSPHQYIMRVRLEKARDLLTRTDLALKYVAQDCGFSDQSHLIRLFKRHTGMTPHQFRK